MVRYERTISDVSMISSSGNSTIAVATAGGGGASTSAAVAAGGGRSTFAGFNRAIGRASAMTSTEPAAVVGISIVFVVAASSAGGGAAAATVIGSGSGCDR